MPLPTSSAPKIATYHISLPSSSATHLSIETSQALHRINLINAWDSAIQPGAQILELGCGQGTCTAVLAEAVCVPSSDSTQKQGHITAIDPGSPDYGSPFTLSQAQSHLSAGPLGDLITFYCADPTEFLSSGRTTLIDNDADKKWDAAVLAHCIWYFPSPQTLHSILSALRGRVSRVCIAEWVLHATEPTAIAHVLATFARATFEAHRTGSHENIQTPMSPTAIKEMAAQTGWRLEKEEIVVPDASLADGMWETGTVVSKGFLEEVEREVGDERIRTVLRSARDAVVAAAEAAGGWKQVRCMDVWVATFVLE